MFSIVDFIDCPGRDIIYEHSGVPIIDYNQ